MVRRAFPIRAPLLVTYLAICGFCALFAQVLTEYLGLCGDADETFSWSAQSASVAGMLVCLGIVVVGLTSRRERVGFRREVEMFARRARKPVFFGSSLIACVAIGFLGHASAHAGGLPHDAVSWLVAATVVSAMSGLFARCVIRSLPAIAAALERLFLAPRTHPPAAGARRVLADFVPTRFEWSPRLYTRPPPLRA